MRSFTSWLPRRKPASSSSVSGRGKHVGTRFRPRFEQLEVRELLSLVINPTFDSSITNDPNAAKIEGTINAAIQAYENSFSDPITVNITFQEGGGLGGSSTYYVTESYTDYRAALVARATTADDFTALASLPAGPNNPVTGDTHVLLQTANARALGFSADVPSDCTITLNTSICNLDRLSIDPNKYDLLAVTAHEIDEALAFGSNLNNLNNGDPAPATIRADDLYRYDRTGDRSYDTKLTTESFFSIDGGATDLAQFNQRQGGDFSDWFSTAPHIPQVQDAFATPGATPNLGVELRRLDVLGYTRVPTAAPVVTATAQATVEGASQAFDLGSVSGGNGPLGVRVSWGDGSPDTTFFVAGPGPLGTRLHTYAEEASYSPTVTVTDFTSMSGSTTFPVAVSDPAVVAAARNISALSGSPFSGTVATFTDPAGAEAISNYTATIDWGDGTALTPGTITVSGGVFSVSGSHTYKQGGNFRTTVTITHEGAPVTTIQGNVNVASVGGTMVWSGASGVDLNWSDPNNWVGHIVPGPGDTAVFDNTAVNRNSTVDAAFAGTVAGLILDRTWGASLSFQHTLTTTGSSTWASGSIYGRTAGLVNDGNLTVTSEFDKSLFGTLINNGTIQHTGGGGGRLFVYNGSRIDNAGTYDFQADGVGIELYSGPATATFINTGTLKKSAGASADRAYVHVDFFDNNGGTIDVESGRLALGSGHITSTGDSIIVATNAVLDLTDGTTAIYSGVFGNGSGGGHVRLRNGTLAVADAPATFDLPQGMLEWGEQGGTIDGGNAGFIIAPTGFLTITSQSDKSLFGTLINNGTIQHIGGGGGRLFVYNDSRIVNAGTYDFQADGVGIELYNGPATATFVNTGTLKKSAGASADRAFVHVNNFNNNGGTIDVESGRLALGWARVNSTGDSIIVAMNAVLDLTDGTTTIYSGFFGNGSGAGHVRLRNGTLAVGDTPATFDLPKGMLEWGEQGGAIDGGNAGFIIAPTGFLTITSQSDKSLFGTLINNGTIQHIGGGGGRLFVYNESRLNNAGVYDFQADGVGIELYNGPATATFINTGTLKKSAGASADRAFVHVNIFNNNGGTIDVESGRLALGWARVNSTGDNIIVATDAVLDLTDGTTTVYSGIFGNGSGAGHVRLRNGTLAVGDTPATFNLPQGMLEWGEQGGAIDGGNAGFIIAPTGFLTINSQSDKSLFGTLINNGTIQHIGGGGGRLFVYNGSRIVNVGTYDFQADGIGIELYNGPATATFVNTGTLKKSAGASVDRAFVHVNIFNNNGGTIDVESGRLALGWAHVTSTGDSIIVATNAVFDLTDGTTTIYSGIFSNGTGGGHVRLRNGTLAVGDTPATFDLPKGMLEWGEQGGTIDGSSSGFVIAPTGFLTITSQSDKSLYGLLINNGTIQHTSGGGRLFVFDDTVINNVGTYDFQGDGGGIAIYNGMTSAFINTGIVRKSNDTGPGGVTLSVSYFSNTNLVDVESGTLNLSSGGASTGTFNAASGTIVNFNGNTHTLTDSASFTGSGLAQVSGGTLVIHGTVTAQNVAVVGGTLKLSADATFAVGGNYTQTGGTLAIDLVDEFFFGQLNIAGSATLGGTLAIALVGSNSPNLGDAFPIVNYGSRTGNPPSQFGGYIGLNIGGGLSLNPVYSASSLTLVVVAAPSPPPSGGAFPGRGSVDAGGMQAMAIPAIDTVSPQERQDPILPSETLPGPHHVDALFQLMAEFPGLS